TEGSVEILGEEMSLDHIKLKRQVSFVPDTPDIIGKLTGREYLNFIASVYEMDRETYAEALEHLLDIFDLTDRLDSLVEEYSHGMRQKLVIIGALVHRPKIIFL